MRAITACLTGSSARSRASTDGPRNAGGGAVAGPYGLRLDLCGYVEAAVSVSVASTYSSYSCAPRAKWITLVTT